MRLIISTALTLFMLATTSNAQMIGNASAGENIFKKCAGCHMVGDNARNRSGPVLNDVIGRVAGVFPDFRYGSDMVAAGVAGLVWSDELIFDYLASPRDFLRGFLDDGSARAKMRFSLPDEQDRLDVIAYLGSFQTAFADMPADICVVNNAQETLFFTVDNGADLANSRVGAALEPGQALCNASNALTSGFVSVFESAEAFEGCSRLISAGNTEGLVRYVDFDRCQWTSQSG